MEECQKFIDNSLRTKHLQAEVFLFEELVLVCFNSQETKGLVNVQEETKSVSTSFYYTY